MPARARYVLATFVLSFYVMGIEILGVRLVAPFLGMTHVTWTASITVVLAGISAGAWLGGFRLTHADPARTVAGLSAAIAVLTALVAAGRDVVLAPLARIDSHTAAAFLAFAVLLLPAAVLASVAVPICYKQVDRDLGDTRRTAGLLHATSALGSVAGVCAVGLWLLPWLGHTALLNALALALAALALSIARTRLVIAAAAACLAIVTLAPRPARPGTVVDRDSAYQRIRVVDRGDFRTLETDPFVAQGAMRLSTRASTLAYARAIAEALPQLSPAPRRILILGGGAFLLARTLRAQHPDAAIDTVEIDPALVEIARSHFDWAPGPRDRTFLEDARTFLRRDATRYDVIVVDVFGAGGAPPFHMVTRELAEALAAHLAPGGVTLVNMYTITEGHRGELFRRHYRALASAFTSHRVLYLGSAAHAEHPGSLIVVLSAGASLPEVRSSFGRWLPGFELGPGPTFTDDHAPVEVLGERVLAGIPLD